MVCTPAKWKRGVERIGYRVIAIAGTTGSLNILETITNAMNVPMVKTNAMYRKLVKWALVNKANTPHCELKSNVAPLKKNAENTIKTQVKTLFKKSKRYGG